LRWRAGTGQSVRVSGSEKIWFLFAANRDHGGNAESGDPNQRSFGTTGPLSGFDTQTLL
jgi:hypothetical protein